MSAHRAGGIPPSNVVNAAPLFLRVKPGQFVIVNENHNHSIPTDTGWWMGQVLFCEGGLTGSKVNRLLQVADVDDGAIRWVDPDQVSHVLHGLDGIGQEGWEGF